MQLLGHNKRRWIRATVPHAQSTIARYTELDAADRDQQLTIVVDC